MPPKSKSKTKPKIDSSVRIAVGLFLVAWVLRWLALSADPYGKFFFNVFYHGDTERYLSYAEAITKGENYDQGLPFHPPLLGWVISFLYDKVEARDFLGVKRVLLFFEALSIPLLYLIGRRLYGELAAVVGALFVAASFSQIIFATSINVESLYVPLLLASILFSLRGAGDRKASSWILAGMAGGLASLLRAEHVPFLGLQAIWIFVSSPGERALSRERLRPPALLAAAAMAVILPWSVRNFFAIRNYQAAHPGELAESIPPFALVTQYGPFNFALANHSSSDGSFDPVFPGSREPIEKIDLANPRHLDLYIHGYSRGLDYWIREPFGAARLIGRKLRLAAGGFSHGLLSRDWPAGLVGVRRPVDAFVPKRSLLIPFWLTLGVAGAWLAWRRNRTGTGLLLMVVNHRIVVTIAFFGYARGGALLFPIAALWGGLAIAALLGPRAVDEEGALRPATKRSLIAAAALLVVCQAVLTQFPVRLEATGSSIPGSTVVNPDGAILLRPLPRN